MPSQTYNPLLIYGPPGTGKTHLLHAIGNLAQQHTPGLKVAFTSAEDFTNRFVDSIRRGEMASFKGRFRDVDLLLLDDAQFLASKSRTEEEFFHTFNQVVDSGSQVVVTCDRMPGDLDALEQRLRDRFASGLVADIAPPDMPSRMAILAMRARRDSLGEVPVEAMEAIAERVKGNVRMLEGALIRVVAYGSLTGTRLSRDLAGQVLDQLYPGRSGNAEPTPGAREIKQMVSETFGVSVVELDSKSRSARIVWPRQVAMYLSREVAGEPLPQIGMAFGGRNHSTVLNACKRVRERVASDPKAALTVKSLERRIVGGDDRVE
jgi:chromosomal replication initiator protein